MSSNKDARTRSKVRANKKGKKALAGVQHSAALSYSPCMSLDRIHRALSEAWMPLFLGADERARNAAQALAACEGLDEAVEGLVSTLRYRGVRGPTLAAATVAGIVALTEIGFFEKMSTTPKEVNNEAV